MEVEILPELNDEWLEIHQKHLTDSLEAYQYLNDLKLPQNPPEIDPKDKISPIEGKKLLIFDMDETLIH